MNLAVIPCRAGSRRIPGKNKRLFHGRPIFTYSVEAAKASGLFDMIVVSTDDDEISAIARDALDVSVHWRPASLCEDHVGTLEVTRYVAEWVMRRRGVRPERVACVYATAPLLTVADIIVGYEELSRVHVAHTIATGPYGIDAGTFYWSKTWALVNGVQYREPHLGRTVLIPIPDQRVCDINDEADFLRAEAMYASLHAVHGAVEVAVGNPASTGINEPHGSAMSGGGDLVSAITTASQ